MAHYLELSDMDAETSNPHESAWMYIGQAVRLGQKVGTALLFFLFPIFGCNSFLLNVLANYKLLRRLVFVRECQD